MSITRFWVACAICQLGVSACNRSDDVASRSLSPSDAAFAEGDEASGAAQLDLNVERARLLSADEGYSESSATSNLVEGTMNMVGSQVVYIAPGPYITTAAQLRTFLESNPANLTAVLTWTAVRADVSADGQRGYTYGYTQIAIPDGTIVPGKYIAYWKRQSDGTWKVAAYRRNLRPAGAVSTTPPQGFETPSYKHYRYFPKTYAADGLASAFAADQAFSDLAQSGVNADAVAFGAPDAAVLLRFTSIGFGADAIAENQISAAPGTLIWSPSLGDAAESADLAFTTGIAFVRQLNPDGTWTVTGSGKYLTIWKKQRTGEWRFVIDG